MAEGKDGKRREFLITDILADKELFWKFVLGSHEEYCKGYEPETQKNNAESIDEVIEKLEKPQNEMKNKLALLKQKAKNVQIENIDHSVDMEKVSKKYDEVINQLIDNVANWQNKNYNIIGYEENEEYIIEFKKTDENIYRLQNAVRTDILKYCNKTETLTVEVYVNNTKCVSQIGALEMLLIGEWIKLVNDGVRNFCKVRYGL